MRTSWKGNQAARSTSGNSCVRPDLGGHSIVESPAVNYRPIMLGTLSFTATGWQGSFYPKGLRPGDYLSYYADHFDTVEIDSTFYATPNFKSRFGVTSA